MSDSLISAGVKLAFDPVDIEGLLQLFQWRRKREVEKYAREFVLHRIDLSLLIMASEEARDPFLHFACWRQLEPEHLRLGDADRAALIANGVGAAKGRAQTAINKMFQVFRERRMMIGHLFITPDESSWHFFYWDQRDTDPDGTHWEHGPHVHFVNHLWPQLKAEAVWDDFHAPKPKLNGGVHLRYREGGPARGTP